MDGQTLNNVEIFNELGTLGGFYFMLYFTDWCPNVKLRNDVGLYFMYYMVAIIAVNFYLILKEMLSGIMLKLWRHINRNLDSKFWQKIGELLPK